MIGIAPTIDIEVTQTPARALRETLTSQLKTAILAARFSYSDDPDASHDYGFNERDADTLIGAILPVVNTFGLCLQIGIAEQLTGFTFPDGALSQILED